MQGLDSLFDDLGRFVDAEGIAFIRRLFVDFFREKVAAKNFYWPRFLIEAYLLQWLGTWMGTFSQLFGTVLNPFF